MRISDAYKVLASSIVIQALKDWEKSTDLLKLDPNNINANLTRIEVEYFFEGSWFKVLKSIAPNVIYDNILEDYKNDSKRVSKSSILLGQKDKGKGKTA